MLSSLYVMVHYKIEYRTCGSFGNVCRGQYRIICTKYNNNKNNNDNSCAAREKKYTCLTEIAEKQLGEKG
jgi:hypothetical protein